MIFSTWLRNRKRSLDRRWALQQTLRRKSGARRLVSRPRLEPLEDRTLLSTVAYVVTSAADSNAAGKLLYAINQVNAGNYNEIDFNIGSVGSAQTINLGTQLPTLTASNVYINGLSQGGKGNTTPLITLNGAGAPIHIDGLLVQGSNCTISGLTVSNFGANGIEIEGSNNLIGGSAAGAANNITGNVGDGVKIDSGVSGNQVVGDYIGTNAAGNGGLGNGRRSTQYRLRQGQRWRAARQRRQGQSSVRQLHRYQCRRHCRSGQQRQRRDDRQFAGEQPAAQ